MLIKDLLINNASEKVKSNTKPYIEIGDINITTKEYTLKEKGSVAGAKYAYKNSILVSTVRPTRGAITIVKEDKIAVSSAFAIIEPNENICNYKYIFYYLNKIDFLEYLGSRSKGATYPTCSKDDIYNYEIDLPSLEIQNKVVKLFDTIKESIHIKNKQLFGFDNLIKSQFIEMFGNPVFNDKGFKKFKLFDKCDIVTGNTPSRKIDEYYGDFIEWIKSDNISDNSTYLTLAKESLSEKGLEVGRYVDKGCILMTCIAGSLNSIGNVAITDKKVSFNQQINGIIPRENDVYFMYEQFVLSKEYLHSPVNMALKGILSKNQLGNLEFIFPPIELQEQFGTFFKQVDKQKFVYFIKAKNYHIYAIYANILIEKSFH